MKKCMPYLALAVLCILALSSCYTPRYMYSPNGTNVPNLTAKGDSKLAVYYATGNRGTGRGRRILGDDQFRNRGLDVQAAYAVTNHWGLLFNHSLRNEINSGEFGNRIDSAVIRYNRRLTELGIGYFGRFNKSKSLFQVFAGYGFGNSNFTDLGRDNNNVNYSRFHRAGVNKIFLQPAIQADISPYFTTSFVNRFNFVFFSRINTDYTTREQESYLLENLEGRTSVFWEPSFINNFGFEDLPGLRFELQLGFASLVSRKFIDYRTFSFSIGAMADLRRVFAKKPPAKGKDK
jgi:hypothetical protein